MSTAAPAPPRWTKHQRAVVPPSAARILLAAEPKVGKSTLAAAWNPSETLLVDTHNGTRLLDGEHYVEKVTDWAAFVRLVDDLEKGDHPFKTVVLDTVEDLFTFCLFAIGDRKGLATGKQIEFNKGTEEAVALVRRHIGRLFATELGIWFIAHAHDVREEGQPTRVEPRLFRDKNGGIAEFIEAGVDYVLLAEARGPVRTIHSTPNAKFKAGYRTPLPKDLPLDARALWKALDDGLNPKPAAKTTDKTDEEATA